MDREAAARALEKIVGADRVLWHPVQTASYGYDSSFATRLQPHPPDLVVQPLNTQETSAVVRWCYENGVPMYPRGAATSQSGGSVAVRGGVCIDLSRMNRILEVLADDLQVLCEPGVVHAKLNQTLATYGLFFPPDPGSSQMCTVGGMVANNASGMRALKYGQTRHYVLGLEVVLPDGEVIETGGVGSRALKTSSGYDLTSLFVGSEGTLGLFTRLRLKVLPLPPHRSVALASFDDLETAGRAVQRVFQRGILPSAIELLDRRTVQAIRSYRPDVVLPEDVDLLLFEVEGDLACVRELGQAIVEACQGLAREVEWTDDKDQAARLWQARRLAGAAVSQGKPGLTRVYAGEDICVPISAIPEALRRIYEIGERYGIYVATLGHVGDGNIHAAPVINIRDPEQVERAHRLVDDIHRMALELHGTTTGEHGVGMVRAQYMADEHGAALEVMRLLKRTLDPRNLMNPGKMALEPSGSPEDRPADATP